MFSQRRGLSVFATLVAAWTLSTCGVVIAQNAAVPAQAVPAQATPAQATRAQATRAQATAQPVSQQAPQNTQQPQQLRPEAQVAIRRGTEFLRAKQYKKALGMYKSAAKLHPRQGQIRHLLGVAYAKDNQLGQAWLQFRQAVRFNPKYTQGIRDFLLLWQGFERSGVFNAGRSSDEVTRLLGKPDSRQPKDSGEVWEYGFKRLYFFDGKLAAVIDPRGIDESITAVTDTLEIEFDDQSRWRLGYRTLDRLQSLTEYIPAKEGVQEWREMYVVQRLHGLSSKKTPAQMMQDIETNLKKANPAVEFRVLSNQPNDVLFHWRDIGDEKKKRKPQHEIVRLIAGDRDVHRLAYVRRVPQIPDGDAKSWANILAKAKVVPTDPAKQAKP